MKKIISILMALVFVFSFAACGGKTKDTSSVIDKGNEIKALLEKGKLDGVDFPLGTDNKVIREHYEDLIDALESAHSSQGGHIHTGEEVMFEVMEGSKTITMDAGNTKFFYEKAKKNNGISVICTFKDVYGFVVGETTKNEIEESLASLNGKTVIATEDDLYFLSVVSKAIILRYSVGDFQLDFYFSDNTLIAAVIMNTKNWTL